MAIDIDSLPPFDRTVVINGVRLSAEAILEIMIAITKPDPRRWYRFEREGDLITVHTKLDEATIQ